MCCDGLPGCSIRHSLLGPSALCLCSTVGDHFTITQAGGGRHWQTRVSCQVNSNASLNCVLKLKAFLSHCPKLELMGFL